jgi:polyribonucleotide nucleotidyltransferase
MENNITPMEPIGSTIELAGKQLTLETNVLAKQAHGSVLVRYGDTAVLCTTTVAEPRAGIDFFPLMVDYEEKFYAAGKIKGSRFIKREGRPSDNAVLASRLIDRPIRPLFPKGFVNDVQVICSVISADLEIPPATTALIGASASLMLSGAPFEGPVGAVRIGRIDGQFIVNPTYEQIEKGDLDFVVAGIREGIMMVEAGANEVAEDVMVEAMELAHKELIKTIDLQEELVAKVKPEKIEYTPSLPGTETIKLDDATFRLSDLRGQLEDFVTTEMLEDVVYHPTKKANNDAKKKLIAMVLEKFKNTPEFPESSLIAVVEELLKKQVRKGILHDGRRPDGRGMKDIRPIFIDSGFLPRTHGSALFQRGETQGMSITTLASKGAGQILDEMDVDTTKYYLHHYNFTPFSVGEVRPLRSAGRREIGHGNLALRALLPVLPSIEEFPYTIRVVTEILESNGSTSMAATCGSTLSLMDAGVPIKKPVSGIAMGLMTDTETGKYAILSDIKDIEDFGGDMDFKVTGTDTGITALQMDIKIKGLPINILQEALEQAKEGREFIMSRMLEAMPHVKEMSKYAPRIYKHQIDPELIRVVIGPGGKMINQIIDECDVEIDIEDDGMVLITSNDEAGAEKALNWIKDLTSTLEVGEIFEGTVTKIVTDRNTGKDIGAIVEKSKGKDGMVHISEMDNRRIEKISEICKVGDKMKVKVLEVDTVRDRVSLSRKALLGDNNPPQSQQPNPGAPHVNG